MTVSLLELRRGPETCGRGAVGVRALRGWPGSAGLSGWAVAVLSGRVAAGQFTAVVTKSALILPCLAVAASLAVAWYAWADRLPPERSREAKGLKRAAFEQTLPHPESMPRLRRRLAVRR
jgi:hypothetical protein